MATTFVRGSNPIWFEVDLTANAFDDTFYLFVLQNELPYLPAIVYHDPEGNVPWNNPIRFLANGTLPIDIFFDPDVVYRLEFRHGNTQQDPLIYLVENYQAVGSGNTPSGDTSIVTDNQMTNAQFSLISFQSPATVTSVTDPDPVNIAPGWTLNLTGTGSYTVTQVPLNDSASTINPTNAPFAMRITLNGSFTAAYLAQRFEQNGNLWATDSAPRYVASSITVRLQGATASISAILINSEAEELTTVLAPVTITEEWNEYLDVGLMPAPADANVPPDSYIEYRLILPTSIDIYVTSFQLIAEDLPLTIAYNQDSIQRQIDYTFHYFKPELEFKQNPSFLVGWDFPLNPAQIFGRAVASQSTGANTGFYAWDQTIVFQTVTNSVAVTSDNADNLNLSPNTTTQTGLIQYIDGNQAKDMLNQPLCVNVRALANSSIGATVSLWYTDNVSAPTLPATFISTLDANGHPATVVSGWTEVPRRVPGTAKIIIPATSGNFVDIPVSGWDLDDIVESEGATFFAIAICTASITNTNNIVFSSISCQAGTIPTRPAPQSIDAVLQDCQYYYESSFPYSTAPAGGLQEALIAPMTVNSAGGTLTLYPNGFGFSYQAYKRAIPTLTFYSGQSTTPGLITSFLQGAVSSHSQEVAYATYWNAASTSTGQKTFWANANPGAMDSMTSATTGSGTILFQYTADSRIGVV